MGRFLSSIRFIWFLWPVVLFQGTLTARPNDVTRLIQELGNRSYDVRANASRRLLELGDEAFDSVLAATRSSSDPEIRARASEILESLRASVFHEVSIFDRERELKHRGYAAGVVTAEGGRSAISCGLDGLVRWNLETGKIDRLFGQSLSGYLTIVACKNKTRVVTSEINQRIRVWRVHDGVEIKSLRSRSDTVVGLAFSGHNDGIHVASNGGKLAYWPLAKDSNYWEVMLGRTLQSLAVSRDGESLALGCGEDDRPDGAAILLVNSRTGKIVRVLTGHQRGVISVVFCADDSKLVSGSYDRSVRVWDVTNGRELVQMVGHEGGVRSVTTTRDGKRVISCSNDNCDRSIRVWDITGELRYVARAKTGQTCVTAAEGRFHVLSTGKDGMLRCWRWTR